MAFILLSKNPLPSSLIMTSWPCQFVNHQTIRNRRLETKPWELIPVLLCKYGTCIQVYMHIYIYMYTVYMLNRWKKACMRQLYIYIYIYIYIGMYVCMYTYHISINLVWDSHRLKLGCPFPSTDFKEGSLQHMNPHNWRSKQVAPNIDLRAKLSDSKEKTVKIQSSSLVTIAALRKVANQILTFSKAQRSGCCLSKAACPHVPMKRPK